MKTISVEQLHRQTDELIRHAAIKDIVVAENGRPFAVLKRCPETDRWQDRERALAVLPKLSVDSTQGVSEDRDRR